MKGFNFALHILKLVSFLGIEKWEIDYIDGGKISFVSPELNNTESKAGDVVSKDICCIGDRLAYRTVTIESVDENGDWDMDYTDWVYFDPEKDRAYTEESGHVYGVDYDEYGSL